MFEKIARIFTRQESSSRKNKHRNRDREQQKPPEVGDKRESSNLWKRCWRRCCCCGSSGTKKLPQTTGNGEKIISDIRRESIRSSGRTLDYSVPSKINKNFRTSYQRNELLECRPLSTLSQTVATDSIGVEFSLQPHQTTTKSTKLSISDDDPTTSMANVAIQQSVERLQQLQLLHPPSKSSTFFSNLMPKRARVVSAPQPEPIRANPDLANRRLMKELAELMRRQNKSSVSYPEFTVETVNDLLSEWYIKIYHFDPDSQISRDMIQHGVEYVKLHAIFPLTYPFEPPFVRVVSPYIDRGFVVEGGAICLELLTKKGWTSAYTMELVIVQLMASFVKGQARLKPTKDAGRCFTRKHAQNAFSHIVRVHNKHGWVDSES